MAEAPLPGIGNLKTFARELMCDMANDLGTRLDWIAVDHWNTDNPHVHVFSFAVVPMTVGTWSRAANHHPRDPRPCRRADHAGARPAGPSNTLTTGGELRQSPLCTSERC